MAATAASAAVAPPRRAPADATSSSQLAWLSRAAEPMDVNMPTHDGLMSPGASLGVCLQLALCDVCVCGVQLHLVAPVR